MKKKYPQKIYKYFDLQKINLQKVRNLIINNKISYSVPVRFNDPFDCLPKFTFRGNKHAFLNRLINCLAEEEAPGYQSPRVIQEILVVEKYIREHSKERIMNRYENEFLPIVREKTALFCLTEKRDDILMWGHYADGHKGICLEFNRAIAPFKDAVKIKYSDKYPSLDYYNLQNDRNFLDKIFKQKSRKWRHEKEWRIIVYDLKSGEQCFAPNALTGIILGVNISVENEQRILKYVRESNNPNVILYRAQKKKTSYGLDIVPMKKAEGDSSRVSGSSDSLVSGDRVAG